MIEGEWLLALSGVASIVLGLAFGLVTLTLPAVAVITVAWLVGGYAIAFGLLLIAIGLRLRSWSRQARPQGVEASVA